MVGPDFKGVKMIPPGVHFVSSHAVSSSSRGTTQGSSDVAPTVSSFVEVALRQVVIRRWNKQEELLLPLEDADEVRLHRRDDILQKHQPARNLSTWEYSSGTSAGRYGELAGALTVLERPVA